MGQLEDAVDALHAVPLEDFVAERKRLAKELRDAGERPAAAELAKLPKPTPPAWALNWTARERPDAVGDWLDAVAGLREATETADKESGEVVRAAIAAHRDATKALLAAVRDGARPNGRELSEPMLDRVRDLLGAATADPGLGELLRAGRIVEGGEDDEQDEGELLWGTDAPATPKPRKAAREASPGGDGTAERRAVKEREAREREDAERAELERLVAAAAEDVERLRAIADERAQARDDAEQRLEEAQRTLHRSESEAGAARAAADEAQAAAEQAERELETLAAKLSS